MLEEAAGLNVCGFPVEMILGKNNSWCHAWVEKSGRMGERVDAFA